MKHFLILFISIFAIRTFACTDLEILTEAKMQMNDIAKQMNASKYYWGTTFAEDDVQKWSFVILRDGLYTRPVSGAINISSVTCKTLSRDWGIASIEESVQYDASSLSHVINR
jgi:hypothetical protein